MTIGPNSQYNSAQPYIKGQQVLLGSLVYQAVQDVPADETPPNGTYWLLVPVPQAPIGGISHVEFPFSYATADLTAGVPVLDVNPGDVIVNAWFSVATAFNGTTPKADVGTFSGAEGLFAELGTVIALGTVDTVPTDNTGLLLPAAAKTLGLTVSPITVTAAGTLLLVVSETGQKGGTATGATAGVATLHLLVATAA